MKKELRDLIWDECNKANNFLEIPAIYKHFKGEKDREEMLYAVSNVSVPVETEELMDRFEKMEYDEFLEFHHTELENRVAIIRVGDKYFHSCEMDNEKLVIYTAMYGDRKTYVRPLPMFISPVDKEKYPDVTQKFRLERVR